MPKSERSGDTTVPDIPVTELWPLEKVWPDPANARLHNPRNLEAIKSSLRRFGQQKPIVVRRDGMILAGNGTYAAIREMGWSEIWLRVSELESIEAAAYALADNRTAELAVWDFEILTGTLRGLQEAGYPLDTLGWESYELEPLLKSDYQKPEIEELPDTNAQTAITSAKDQTAQNTLTFTAEQWITVQDVITCSREFTDDTAAEIVTGILRQWLEQMADADAESLTEAVSAEMTDSD